MKRVFADTSFYIALVRPEDENHQSSSEFDRHFDGQSLTEALSADHHFTQAGFRALLASREA